jgi:hypothetical protein
VGTGREEECRGAKEAGVSGAPRPEPSRIVACSFVSRLADIPVTSR